MIFKRLIFILIFIFIIARSLYAVEEKPQMSADQEMGEFSIEGTEKGKKAWDIKGQSAEIFEDTVKLKDLTSNLYGEKEDIKLTADKGDFNRKDGKINVEENVVITTSSGAKLTTDSLEWDRKKQLVSTKDIVNITRDNMVVVAQGAEGEPNLSKVVLEKDVKVDINPKEKDEKGSALKNKVAITCDGPLEIDYAKNIAVFKNNVKVDTEGNQIYSDLMDVYFLSSQNKDKEKDKEETINSNSPEEASMMGAKIDKIVARGNVKIIKGENVSYSDEATYSAIDKKITLTGKPRLIIYSTEDLSASLGN